MSSADRFLGLWVHKYLRQYLIANWIHVTNLLFPKIYFKHINNNSNINNKLISTNYLPNTVLSSLCVLTHIDGNNVLYIMLATCGYLIWNLN